MDLRQTIHMIRYRWIPFVLVFAVVFAGCLGGIMYLERKKAAEELKATQEKIPQTYTSEIAFGHPDITSSSIEWYRVSVANLLARMEGSILFDQDVSVRLILENNIEIIIFTKLADENEQIVIQTRAEGNTVRLSITGNDTDQLSVIEEILSGMILDYLDANLSGWRFTQSVTRNVPQTITPKTTPASSSLGAIFNLLISFTLASLCALVIVFATENLDKSIRSVHHLKKAVDIPVLPLLSPRCTESELVAVAGALPVGKPVVLCGMAQDSAFPALTVRLAEAVAREEFPVAVVDFCGDVKSVNPHVTVVSAQAKTARDSMSSEFSQELTALQERYNLVLLLAPAVKDSGIGVSLSGVASVVLLVRWGKDSDEHLQYAVGCFGGKPDALAGAVITGYRPNVEYIKN